MDPSLLVIGMNSGKAPEVRGAWLHMTQSQRSAGLLQLAEAEAVDEIVILATAERTDFVLWTRDAALAAGSVVHFLTREYGLQLAQWQHFYRLLDEAALLHLFRFAAGLDSPRRSAAKAASQLNTAWLQARDMATTGHFLDAILQQALAVSRRVQNEAATLPATADAVKVEARFFRNRLLAERITPAAADLGKRLDRLCRQELEAFRQEAGGLSPLQLMALETIIGRIAQRLAGTVAQELKQLPGRAEQEQFLEVVRQLFRSNRLPKAAVGGNLIRMRE